MGRPKKPIGSKVAVMTACIKTKDDNTNKLKILVYDDIMKGYQKHEIVDKLLNNKYKIHKKFTVATAGRFLDNLRRDLKKLFYGESKEELKNLIVCSFMDLYKEARLLKDFKTSVSCLKEISALLGLYELTNTINSLNAPVVISFGFNNTEETPEIAEPEIIEDYTEYDE